MKDVKPHIKSILTFIEKTINQVSQNDRILVRARALYRCECGNVKEMVIDSVRSGKSKSCGCLSSRKTIGERRSIHQLRQHPLYYVWAGIKARCLNKNNPVYEMYGGRGVTICAEWENDFMCFYNWAISNGWTKGMHVDKDIKGGKTPVYSPSTCVVVTPKKNANNRRSSVRITYDGCTRTVSEWGEFLGININPVYDRIARYGWTPEEALKKSIQTKK